MKTIIQIAQDLAPHLGIATPSPVVGSVEQEVIDVLRCINEAGLELMSRFDWPQLQKEYVITLTGNVAHNLPSDYSRMVRGAAVMADGSPVRGALADDEFARLVQTPGVPRYYRSTLSTIQFWPYASAGSARVTYISRNWLAGDRSVVSADDNTPLFEDELVRKGALVRFKRMKGHDFTDYLAEYEGDLSRYSTFSRSERTP